MISLLLMAAMAAPAPQETAVSLSRRRADLAQLRRVLPPSPAWDAWLEKTGELPPDFAALPDLPFPPSPLAACPGGAEVLSAAQWPPRRAWLLAQMQRWLLGTVPPAPERVRAEVLSERREQGALSRQMLLSFGPQYRARLRAELLIPDGRGPFPVLLTQHNHRAWALIALRRGYLACVYAAADSQDDTDSFLAAYPEHDWSRLTRRAWAAGRCIDYLLRHVPQADRHRIAITGHSRNGKQSLIAAALDERIACVISSSSGAGGPLSAREFSEQHGGEGIEFLTRVFPDWFHARLRFFVGRENRLPVDFHLMPALAAPRACLLSVALNDPVESTWAMEQTYRSALPVYRLLGAGNRLGILHRPGGHETTPWVIERYLDWCDVQFGRARHPFHVRQIHPHDWQAWSRRSGSRPPSGQAPAEPPADRSAWESRRTEVRRAVGAMLGEEPPGAAGPGGDYGRERHYNALMLERWEPEPGVDKDQVVFGEYINGDVWMPAGLKTSGRKAPAVLWLHPWTTSYGYGFAYKRGPEFYQTLAKAGFVVFCFDQIGFGRRIEEAEGFFDRHPRWSLLGKMVRDSRSALDALLSLPYVDSRRAFVAGYSLGAMVGLHLAAVDDRPAGFACVCGPPEIGGTPAGAAAARLYGRETLVLPLLGHFADGGVPPYAIGELIACAAPRPVLVVSPLLDREAPPPAVEPAVRRARAVYGLFGATAALERIQPEDYNRFGPETQQLVIDWLRRR